MATIYQCENRDRAVTSQCWPENVGKRQRPIAVAERYPMT